jgi:broad specificity phosphatase PhoE
MEKFIGDKTHVILARHGQTEWNRHKMLMGRTDEPLTEEGFNQAEALAERLKDFGITTVVSSPMLRAKQTAETVGNRLGIAPIKVHQELRERNYGRDEGRMISELKAEAKARGILYFLETPPAGEEYSDFVERVTRAFDEIIGQHLGGKILIVSHSGVIHYIIRRLNNIPLSDILNFKVGNASFHVFSIDKEARGNFRSLGELKE